MRRAFLITFLLTAQIISWNASPLFLCVDGDGSLCIDLGPGSCACCQHHHDDADEPAAVLDSHDRQQTVTTKAEPCDCTHLQLTVAWTAVTVSPAANRFAALPAVSAFVGHYDCGATLLPSATGASLDHLSSDLPTATTFRSAILRC